MTRFILFIVGLSALSAGCGYSSSPTEPSEAASTRTTFTVALSAANEVPSITNADANAVGTAVIVLNVSRNAAGIITGASADFQVSVSGFPAGTRVTDAHVHTAPAGSNGGVAINTTLSSGELAIANGSGSVTKNGINVPADRAAAILANPAGHYFNVHTALNPDGAIRGQLPAGSTAAQSAR